MYKTSSFARKRIAIILLALSLGSLLAVKLLSPNKELFSSDTSPNGLLIAENFAVDGFVDPEETGLIVITERGRRRVGQIGLPDPDAGIFFRWIDNAHLQILRRDRLADARIDGSRQLNGVYVSMSTFPMLTAAQASDKMSRREVHEFQDADVSASLSKDRTKIGELCKLQIAGKHGSDFERLGIEIDAQSDQCVRGEDGLPSCGGMTSRFWVSEPQAAFRRLILTSADVSGADGYGMLPTGADQMAIRGQFLESSATRVAERLANGRFSVDYNFEFSDLSLQYHFPLRLIRESVSKFLSCIGFAE